MLYFCFYTISVVYSMNTRKLLLAFDMEDKQTLQTSCESQHFPPYCCHCRIPHILYNYVIHVLYNVCVSGYFYIHFTATERAGESSTPPWRLKASMPGTPPCFFWVTDPTHTHVLFKFKEQNIRGRRERQWWVSTNSMQSHRPRTVYCASHHRRPYFPTLHSKLISTLKTENGLFGEHDATDLLPLPFVCWYLLKDAGESSNMDRGATDCLLTVKPFLP